MNKNSKTALFTGANLVANAAVALMAASPSQASAQSTVAASQPQDTTAAQVNSASIASIEESFVRVPHLCKARTFAFDPIVVGSESVSNDVLAIHAALEVEAGVTA